MDTGGRDASQLHWHLASCRENVMSDIRADRIGLFRNLESPATQPQFWACVAPDVDWTVEGTHALAGHYRNKQEFIDATFSRLDGVLQGGVKLEVEQLYVDGDTTIAELLSTSTTNEGASFDNRYCWVCRFDGDMIVEVRAYLDSMMVDYTIQRNELAKQ
jgi:ketosteroid isomerase-like protein